MRNDFIICNGESIAARRATFGRHISVSGQAVFADPFLADSELSNKDRIQGSIAVIGRGVTPVIDSHSAARHAWHDVLISVGGCVICCTRNLCGTR